jgi:hypothetical protein
MPGQLGSQTKLALSFAFCTNEQSQLVRAKFKIAYRFNNKKNVMKFDLVLKDCRVAVAQRKK